MTRHTPKAALGSLTIISLIYFAVFLGNSIWRTTLNNYAAEGLHLNSQQVAALFSIAAVPGVLAFGVGLLSSRLRLYLLLGLSSALVGGGLICAGTAVNWGTLALSVACIATGFTFFYPVANSVGILASVPSTTAVILGRIKSLGPLAGLGGALFLLLLLAPDMGGALQDLLFDPGNGNMLEDLVAALASSPGPETDAPTLRTLFTILGATIIALGVLAAMTVHRAGSVDIRSNLCLQATLWPYYVLNFLAGCRSGLFQAFVLFMLIDRYGLRIHGTALLVLCGHLCSFAGYRVIGRLTRVWSARHVLMGLYIVVAANFVGFAWLVDRDPANVQATLIPLAALFLVDSLIFGASVITDASLKRPERSSSVVGDLAAGVTLYYLGAAVIPVAGSLLVERFHYSAAFLMGSGLALLAVLVSHFLPTPPGRTERTY